MASATVTRLHQLAVKVENRERERQLRYEAQRPEDEVDSQTRNDFYLALARAILADDQDTAEAITMVVHDMGWGLGSDGARGLADQLCYPLREAMTQIIERVLGVPQ